MAGVNLHAVYGRAVVGSWWWLQFAAQPCGWRRHDRCRRTSARCRRQLSRAVYLQLVLVFGASQLVHMAALLWNSSRWVRRIPRVLAAAGKSSRLFAVRRVCAARHSRAGGGPVPWPQTRRGTLVHPRLPPIKVRRLSRRASLADSEHHEGIRDQRGPRSRLLRGGRRRRSKIRGHEIHLAGGLVERHGARAALRAERLNHRIVIRRILMNDRQGPFAI